MRSMERNKQDFHYALYEGKETVTGEYGDTGEPKPKYSKPVLARGTFSAAQGIVATELFGTLEGYDRVLIVDDPSCSIDEHSIIWFGFDPMLDRPHNYVIKRVSRSLNSVAYAIRQVVVS